MELGTLCSGIEGAGVGLEPLGWRLRFCAEIDPFANSVIEHHYSEVVNYGDITASDLRLSKVDVIAAGTPCQSFSVNASRKGMATDSGRLAQRFAGILSDLLPRWFVWENVPGVLSTNQGRDFKSFLNQCNEIGYGVAWRILDLRYFGVPQRRRRVWVVGHLGNWAPAAAALFESPAGQPNGAEIERRRKKDAATLGPGKILGWTGDITPKCGVDVCPTLRSGQGGEGVGIANGRVPRRFTPLEWERLSGFPDYYTDIPGATDAKRRFALGNTFAPPVIQWIGKRIQFLEDDNA